MKDFIKNMFSINEGRTSTLIITFIPCVVVLLILVYQKQFIPDGFVEIMKWFIFAIGGVNIATPIASAITNKFDDNQKGSV
jgi:Flp pilus assembly protein TadB